MGEGEIWNDLDLKNYGDFSHYLTRELILRAFTQPNESSIMGDLKYYLSLLCDIDLSGIVVNFSKIEGREETSRRGPKLIALIGGDENNPLGSVIIEQISMDFELRKVQSNYNMRFTRDYKNTSMFLTLLAVETKEKLEVQGGRFTYISSGEVDEFLSFSFNSDGLILEEAMLGEVNDGSKFDYKNQLALMLSSLEEFGDYFDLKNLIKYS